MASSLVSVTLSPSPVFLSPSKTLKDLTFSLKPRNLPVLLALRSTQSDSPPAVDKFWQWLTDEGIVSDKSPARPGLVQEGLGLIAQRDISRNEVVLEIPKRFWINPDTVSNSEIGNVCGGLKPWISVALFLIREKKKKKRGGSKWRNYIDVLPETTNSTIYWSDEELAEIQGTQLLSSTLAVKDYIKREFLKVQEEVILPNKRLFPFPTTFDDFLWAFGILKSRAFSRLRGQNLVLVPLADLINHNPTITTEDYAYEIKGAGLFSRDLLFSLRCPVSVKAGEQVLIQYDLGKSNAELALDYGFIETRSDRNAYTLTLQIAESDPFFRDKVDAAETNGLGQTACFDIVLGRALPPKMLPYLRLVVLSGTDVFLLESIFEKAIWGHLESPLSRANEELVSRVVRDTCKAANSGYHTAIEEDENLQERGNLAPKLEIAVGIRAGEKKVLQQIDGIFKERELKLDEMEYHQERRLRELGLVGEQGDIIFREPK